MIEKRKNLESVHLGEMIQISDCVYDTKNNIFFDARSIQLVPEEFFEGLLSSEFRFSDEKFRRKKLQKTLPGP